MDGKRTPNVHPKPFESVLWRHFETIRSLRRKRKTWIEIAAHLEQTHGLKTSFQAVQKFFKRASTGRIPLGFNDTGLMTKTDELPKPNIEVSVKTPDDAFSVDAIPDDLFAKTKRKYDKERKA